MENMARLMTAGNTDIASLQELETLLANGSKVRVVINDEEVKTLRFKPAANPRHTPQVMAHGIPARDFKQVLSYLEGDSHDRSKLQWFSGEGFKNWF